MTDPYYQTPHWQRLRSAALKRDRGVCVVPGCGQRAVVVDHIKRRRDGGRDVLVNVRSLCREHDNAVKERPNGKRANAGKLVAKGCFADGSPRDPSHPWFKGRGGSRGRDLGPGNRRGAPRTLTFRE